MESALRRAILATALCAPAAAQVSTINASDAVVSVSLPAINANFAYLNGKQLSGNGAPTTGCSSSTVGTIYARKDAGAASSSFYLCANLTSGYAWEGPYTVIAGAPSTWPSAFAPIPPTGSTLGGVESVDCTGTGHILKISTSGVPSCSADASITGAPSTWPSSFPPVAPTGSTLGGVESIDCTGTGHILKISTSGVPSCSSDAGTSGSGIVSLTTGSGAPVLSCTAPSSSNLQLYFDQTNLNLWECVASNSWELMLATPGTGPYLVTGASGTAPSNPASGKVSCYFDSTATTQVCLNSSGAAYVMVKGASSTSHQWVAYVDALGIQHFAQPSVSDLSDGTTGTGSVVRQTAPTLTTPIIQSYTVSTLPGSPSAGMTAYVTDGSTTSDCTTGGGSNRVLCTYNGSAWAFPGGSSGGGSSAPQVGVYASKPACSSSPFEYRPTDWILNYVCTGSTLYAFFGTQLVTPPGSVGSYTTLGTDSFTTITQLNDGISFTSATGDFNWLYLLSSNNFASGTASVQTLCLSVQTALSAGCGPALIFSTSYNYKFSLILNSSQWQLSIDKVVAGSSSNVWSGVVVLTGAPRLRIRATDATHAICEISVDGGSTWRDPWGGGTQDISGVQAGGTLKSGVIAAGAQDSQATLIHFKTTL